MEITRTKAMKMWEAQFGKCVDATDFSGRKLQKGAYDQKTSDYGWCLCTVIPKDHGGTSEPENLICAHIKTAGEKSLTEGMYPFFKANDIRFSIVSEGDNARIEVARDDVSAAEEKAKYDAAMEMWNTLIGADVDSSEDFCGRPMSRAEFGTDAPDAWKTAPFVESRPMERNNVYIANLASIAEALGKTAFRANGRAFGLNKENGAYYFKESAPKPKRTAVNVYDPGFVDALLGDCKNEFSSPGNAAVWLDIVTIRAVLPDADPQNPAFPTASAITDALNSIIREHSGAPLMTEVSDTPSNGQRYIFIHFRFLSQSVSDIEKYFDLSMLLNTYAVRFCETFGLSQFRIYDYTGCFDTANIYTSVARLCATYPDLGALMNVVYNADEGMHPDENDTTLYLSQYVVGNVPELSEAHADDVTYTDAVMFEHNYIFDLSANEQTPEG